MLCYLSVPCVHNKKMMEFYLSHKLREEMIPMKDAVKTRFNFFQVCYEENSMKRLPELLQSLQEISLEQRQHHKTYERYSFQNQGRQ